MKIKALLGSLKNEAASDLHLCVGLPPILRSQGALKLSTAEKLTNDDIVGMIESVLPKGRGPLTPYTDMDLGIEVEGAGRFRLNIYYDNNGICCAFRAIPQEAKTLVELGLPRIVEKICGMRRGLVLFTGIAGSGKSTTITAIIDKINRERRAHIITLEDPIEFVHDHKKSIVNQREVGAQVASFADGLKSSLREDPDIIVVGEMRDLETIALAITAAETGHLVLGTLHTRGAPQSIDRMIDVFGPNQQDQIRVQLADALEFVVSQVLVPSVDGLRRYLGCEIMVTTSAIRHLIRDKKTHQIKTAIETGSQFGMQTLEESLKALVTDGKVSKETAFQWITNKALFDIY